MEKEEKGEWMFIYISPRKNVSITEKKMVYMSQVADIIAPNEQIEADIKKMMVLLIHATTDDHFLLTVVDLIRFIQKKYKNYNIQNIGSETVMINYIHQAKKEHPLLSWGKIFFVSMVLLAGSSTAIMTFHSDSELPVVFENYYYLFFDKKIDTPLLLDLPYSIGLILGIMVFFNHFNSSNAQKDPTPIEVEMASYEEQVRNTLLSRLDDYEADYEKVEKAEKEGKGDK